MKNIIVLISLCFVFISFSQKLVKTYYDYDKIHPDEIYYVNTQGQKNGLYTKYTDEGAKALEATYVNGVLNGAAKEYYTRGPSSKLKISGTFKNDEKHGQFVTFTYVKYGQSYYEIMQNFAFNDKEADIFNTGVQTKVVEETFKNGSCTKEIKYHLNGKVFYTANFNNRRYIGDYVCYNDKSVVIAKGKIGDGGKMIGLWIVPRDEKGDCPRDKHDISNVKFTQKLKFDEFGIIDSNYMSKSYFLSGKLKDSVRVSSLEYNSGYDWNGMWYFCGPTKNVIGYYNEYFENGKQKISGYHFNGKREGTWKWWYENGQLKRQALYLEGVFEGQVQQWYNTGQLESEQFWSGGVISSQKCWNQDGTEYSCQ